MVPAPLAEDHGAVSVLFNEPKLLKFGMARALEDRINGFSALQRAEIAEIQPFQIEISELTRFSALQRAEIAEIFWGAIPSGCEFEFQCSSTSRNC